MFVRQAPGHSLEGQWSIPWGFVNPGETPEAAALREVCEEAGIIAELKGLLGLQNLPEERWIGLIFLCHHQSGVLTPDGEETDRAAYFSLADMDALDEPFEPWCAWLVRRVLDGRGVAIPPVQDSPYPPRIAFL